MPRQGSWYDHHRVDPDRHCKRGHRYFPHVFLPDRELPLVDLALLVKAGSVDVDDSKSGLTSLLTGSIIRGGTESYSPAELALVLDEHAIQISIAVREEEAVIHLSVLKEDWQVVADL